MAEDQALGKRLRGAVGDMGMRFLFCDRVVQIEKGKSIDGVKAFSLSEEFLKGHFARIPLVPGVIFIEAMAQLLGWLIIYSHDFRCLPIISLIEDVTMAPHVNPGFRADIHAEIISTSETDSLGKAWIHVDGELVASADRMIYSHLGGPGPEVLLKRFEYHSRNMKIRL